MRKNYLYTVVLSVLIVAMSLARDPKATDKKRPLFKADGTPSFTLMNINKMAAWYASNGEQEHARSGNSGVFYPRGTSTVIFSGGLMWGGKVQDGKLPVNRVNGHSYSETTVPGAILNPSTGETQDPDKPEVRIWRIRRDYATADLGQDAAEFNSIGISQVSASQIADIRAQYEKDWKEWPFQFGAPYYDKDNNGTYNPKFLPSKANGVDVPDTSGDQPGLADADQVVWYVFNDLKGDSPWQSPPIGVEVQTTVWGYNRQDALGNMVFKKFKLIYKGTPTTPANATIDDMYLTQWSDPDLGDAGDDYAGCDTTLSLGYVYNSTTDDTEYKKYNIAPPASGYDFLQGPLVDGVAGEDRNKNGVDDAVDFGIFDLKKVGPGKINLPMTSFIYFAAGGTYSDPPFSANGGVQWYNMMQGLPPTPQGPPPPPPLVIPGTTIPTSYWLSGDPTTGSGWIDGGIDIPGDRRFLLTSGPFTLAKGDTQELVSALIAGVGSDYKSSIKVLKFYDRATQGAYDNLFDLPKPPIAPKLSVTELDKGIILSWEIDPAAVQATEGSLSKGYRFEGYNVYQFPSQSATLSSAKRIATFDLPGDPATILQEDLDEASSEVLLKVAQLGKNTGLTRYMYIQNDAIKNRPLVNGQQYYFAVTAYNYNDAPNLVLRTLESSPEIKVAVPHQPDPGIVLPYSLRDTIISGGTNVVGSNDGEFAVTILDPSLITKDNNVFDIWYGGSGTSRDYTLVKPIPNSTDYAKVTASLNATKQIPSLNLPNAVGTGTFTINDARDQITYTVSVSGLSSALTAGHIHYGSAATANGTVVKTLNFSGGVATGSWTKTDATQPLVDSLVKHFISGNLYVNVHTATNPGGEIRGQIADGLITRRALPAANATAPVAVTSYAENRFPADGVKLFVGPSKIGIKTVGQTAPSTDASVVGSPNNENTYSIVPSISDFRGVKVTDSPIEIRFTAATDTNWAMLRQPAATATSGNSIFIRVPFRVYVGNVRVWPVLENPTAFTSADSAGWNTTNNPLYNGKPTFDKIWGITDTTSTALKYPANNLPPTSGITKSAIFGTPNSPSNHVAANIVVVNQTGTGSFPAPGTIVRFTPNKSVDVGDIKRISLKSYESENTESARAAVSLVNVFPNPYYGVNTAETTRENRFVTFSHLPRRATFRIFNLAGVLVRTLQKDSPSQFFQWNLQNERGLPVASGLYLVHIDMGSLGTKILKAAIIQEQQYLQNY